MGKHMGIALILTALLFFLAWLWAPPAAGEQEPPDAPADAETADTGEETAQAAGADESAMLRVLIDGELQEMDMATYLRGVVRSEMPASFALEALKAQAVAARTYVRYHMENGGMASHPEADACDDITCCQAYLSAQEAAANWGDQAAAYEAKIDQAVAETDGECVLYEGRPILAAFHSSSAGATQDAADVWSSSLPYLQSVESPENEDTVPNYRSSASFSAADLKAKLQELFYGGFASEADTTATITALYDDGYLIDTHTAVAAKVLEDYRRETGDDTVAVFASTASPYKFCDSVLTAIGETPVPGSVDRIAQLEEASGVPAPKRLAALKGKAPGLTA